jgi:hypothetical protein
MNFSDFGVKDESELEQDEFSLSRPTFGKDNQLTVIGWKEKAGTNKYYIVKCSKCSKDPELFGEGVFRRLKSDILRGKLPCGCSFHPYWSEDQYKTLIERKCKEKGYIFQGFADAFNGIYTKLKLECKKHGIWETSNINSFLSRDILCPHCQYDNLGKRSTKADFNHIINFISTGKFKEGTKFWRSERLDPRHYKAYWFYTCPVCSNDEYVKAGICSGIFESHISSLQAGRNSCRCGGIYHWTQEQYEYRIKKKMLESGTTDEFVGFVDGFNNAKSKFTRSCRSHKNYTCAVVDYMSSSSGCPLCANHAQQECYINFIKDNDSTIALKFGIAKDSKVRVKQHNSKSIFSIEQHGIWSFPDVNSCKAAEKFIKQNLKCKLLTKQEMPDGYTETTSVENLEAIIKIYEDFGGVRKIINDKETLIESEDLLEDKSL